MIGNFQLVPFTKIHDANKIYADVKYFFYLKNEPDKAGLCPIYLSVRLAGIRKRIPVELKIKADCWNNETKTVEKCEEANDYNLILRQIEAKITTIKVNYRLAEKPLTMNIFLEHLKNAPPSVSVVKFYHHAVKNLDIAAPTKRKHDGIFSKLEAFSPHLSFPEVDYPWFDKYRKYLKTIGNNQPTINTNIAVIKRYLRLAQEYGIKIYVDPDKIKTGSTGGRIIWLTEKEIAKFEEYYYSSYIPHYYKITIGYFLFAYYAAGIRISDILSFTRKQVEENILHFVSFKTKHHHQVKISDKARAILDHTPELFIEKKTEQKLNVQLKLIATHLGIKKRIFFHVARHSFATNYLKRGGKIEDLQKLMGHSSITTTMKYVHVLKEEAALTVDIMN